jgi:EmrB/QacA subfamily drug resistance transporter
MTCGPIPCKEVSAPAVISRVQQASTGRWVLAATVLGSSMDFIDGTVVNVALPSLQTSLGATGTQAQWVVEAYALFLSSLLLVGGSLGDRFGLRRTFLCGVVLFACASMWCGLAPGIHQLLVARCLQGIGGALVVPNSLAFLSAHFGDKDRGRAIGTWSGFASVMTALGPVLGGWVVQHGSWRWVFFLNAPIALVTVWITLSKTPAFKPRPEQTPLDLKGGLLAMASLSCLTFSLMEWSTRRPACRITGVTGLFLFALFIVAEQHAESPIMPLELFRSRNFAGANLLTLFLYGGLSAALYYLPLNLIQAQGYTPTKAGAAMLPFILLMFFLSHWAGGLIEHYGARTPLIAGPFLAALGFFLLARPGVGGSYWTTYFPAVIVLGLGMTISVAPLTTVVMSSVTGRRAGSASGVNNAVSQVAALLALALSAPLFFAKFSSDLTEQLKMASLPAPVSMQIQEKKRDLGAIQTSDPRGRKAVDEAFVGAFRLIAVIAAASSAAAGATAMLTIRNTEQDPPT